MGGWEPWLFAVADAPTLALTWPQLLHDLLQFDSSYVAWEHASTESDRIVVMDALRTREWDGLSAGMRLDILCWLSENTSQCQTVRFHLERNYEAATELRRERKQHLEDEEKHETVRSTWRS